MMKLYINDMYMGECLGYRSTRDVWRDGDDHGHYTFAMRNGIAITVDKMQIKLFTSCPDLSLLLYGRKEVHA